MLKYFIQITLLLSIWLLSICSSGNAIDARPVPPILPPAKKIVGYYAGWSIYRQPSFKPSDIDAQKLTHINYAFIQVDRSGNLSLFDPWADVEYRSDWDSVKPFWGNFRELVELKIKYPHLKTLFSVGGWTLSDTFSDMAADPTSRQNFVKQAIQFANKYQFDGIDIDWEYPGYAEHSGKPEDTENFTLLLQELYAAAKNNFRPLLVTIAAPAGAQHIIHIEVEKIAKSVDWINLMTYDFYGPWPGNETTNHNAPLHGTPENVAWNIDSAIQYYLNHGVPSYKLVMGLAFYGRSFGNVGSSSDDGLFANYSGPGQATTAEPGMRFFYEIQNLLPRYLKFWDGVSQVPYLYSPTEKEFISYDDERSIAIKAQYIKQRSLAGAMIWELGLDTKPEGILLNTVYEELLGKKAR